MLGVCLSLEGIDVGVHVHVNIHKMFWLTWTTLDCKAGTAQIQRVGGAIL